MDVEIKVTPIAQAIFDKATEPYVRVGANSGGCSGWRYELETSDDMSDNDVKFGSVIVEKDILTNVLGSITIDYKESSNMLDQGFVFVSNSGSCGCGKSFQPVNPDYNHG